MNKLKDIHKVYFFYFLGICAGYLGTFDKVNLLLITIPTILLITNSNFEFQKALADRQKQANYALILSILKDGASLIKSMNVNPESFNIDEIRNKIINLFNTFFDGMGLPKQFQNFVFNNLMSQIRN